MTCDSGLLFADDALVFPLRVAFLERLRVGGSK
jgi:hypothetical protein